MKAETIHHFTQVDADEYMLTWNDGEHDHALTMGSFEAIRLYNLVVKQLVGHVTEMHIAKASFERGEGPNGEPRGTWEGEAENDALLERDAALYGVSFVDVTGKRIDPATVSFPEDDDEFSIRVGAK